MSLDQTNPVIFLPSHSKATVALIKPQTQLPLRGQCWNYDQHSPASRFTHLQIRIRAPERFEL